MAVARHIAGEMTVRQAAATWPACAELLPQCPGAKWEGRWSPIPTAGSSIVSLPLEGGSFVILRMPKL